MGETNMIQHKQPNGDAEAGLSLQARPPPTPRPLRRHLGRGSRLHLQDGIPKVPTEAGQRATPLSKNTTTWQTARNGRAPRTLLPGTQSHRKQTCQVSRPH